MEITEHRFESARHRTFYLASGPEDGPLMVFVHGWPELSLSWRHQLPYFGALGFRAIAPDMRGYGRSSVPDTHDAYALEQIVEDMIELLDGLGRDNAVWVGHDWGAPVVWSLASHHPGRTSAVANLCVPYRFGLDGLDGLTASVDRSVYPQDTYPAGPWDYMFHYQENFAAATAEMEVNPYNTIVALFRAGDPGAEGQPAFTATIRKNGGWFPGLDGAPGMPLDQAVLSEADARAYAAALEKNGFFGPGSYYMNFDANRDYGARADNSGRLDMPVLFIHAAYDFVCETLASRLAEPMREYCSDLSEAVIESGHWMAQEKPDELNRALASWLEQTEVRDQGSDLFDL
jgi:pimeloyl-ACP methyl ester carboxylesterase